MCVCVQLVSIVGYLATVTWTTTLFLIITKAYLPPQLSSIAATIFSSSLLTASCCFFILTFSVLIMTATLFSSGIAARGH